MAKDYYLVLGVNPTASARRIKRAYRELAKRYHPDSGQADSDAARFREVSRAYETLADADRRRQYDAELAAADSRADAVRRTPIERMRRRPRPVEPLTPTTAFGTGVSLAGDPSERDVLLEIILSPAEAATGGVFPIHLPATGRCANCHGGDEWERFFCPVCGGRGRVTGEQEIGVSIPPGTPHGAEAAVRLGELRVRMRILVDPNT